MTCVCEKKQGDKYMHWREKISLFIFAYVLKILKKCYVYFDLKGLKGGPWIKRRHCVCHLFPCFCVKFMNKNGALMHDISDQSVCS